MIRVLGLILLTGILTVSNAQQKRDTVIVELAKTSKIIFTIQDKKDLDILKHYDFQNLFKDIITKLEKSDTSIRKNDSVKTEVVTKRDDHWKDDDYGNEDNDDNDHYGGKNWNNWHKHQWRKNWQTFTFDLGTNNYLSKGKFPNQDNANYAVRPWGSWYFAMNSTQRTRMGKNFFFEWGLGLSWYNFKFQNDNVKIEKNPDGIAFVNDTRDFNFVKSKLTATYINASFIPVLDFSDDNKKSRIWDGNDNGFRIGLGPYIGYRVASHSKEVYNDGGHREKEKYRNDLYMNNFRYGARLQVGFHSTDLFFNYDLNELFSSGKGPNLNAFSFGVIF